MGPLHRTGRKSCANVRMEMEKAGEMTDKISVYIRMRTDATGNPKDKDTADIIQTLDEMIGDLPEEEQTLADKRNELFDAYMGRENHGRMRTMGSGPTPSLMKGKNGNPHDLDAKNKEELRKEFTTVTKVLKDQIANLSSQVEFLTSQILASQGQDQIDS